MIYIQKNKISAHRTTNIFTKKFGKINLLYDEGLHVDELNFFKIIRNNVRKCSKKSKDKDVKGN